MLCRSAPVSSHDSINAYHRQISLTGTDHNISKLFKVIQVEKKQSLNILIFEKICKRIIKKKKKTIFPVKNIGHTLYASHSFFLTLITISFICSITFQYLSPLSFHFFFCFYFTYFFLICSPTPKHILQFSCIFNSIWLQPAFDYSISLQYTIQKIFTKLQTTFQNKVRNGKKDLLWSF